MADLRDSLLDRAHTRDDLATVAADDVVRLDQRLSDTLTVDERTLIEALRHAAVLDEAHNRRIAAHYRAAAERMASHG